MNDLIKSIRVGAVDFFGIMMPGILLLTMCTIGFFIPLILIIMNLTGSSIAGIDWQEILSRNVSLILTILVFAVLVSSYVIGYILRLSSPDELDKKSAKKVIEKEKRASANFEEDCWPYNLDDKTEKYPYSRFRDYLKKRGHLELIDELVTWCPDDQLDKDGGIWKDETHSNGKSIPRTKRSKSAINEMKIKVRLQCPELSALIESKEGHIRLMAGTWTAFSLSLWLVGIAGFIITTLPIIYPALHWCWVFSFINLNLIGIMLYSNNRIVKFFHYRRVSELFHIVQAAHLAQQRENMNAERSR